MSMEQVCEVIGTKENVEKGKESYTLYLAVPFEDWEVSKENVFCMGLKIDSVWVRGTLPCKVGDRVEVIWGRGYEGKAVCKGVRIVNKSKS